MLIIPAIDLQEGVCVRLLRGDFDASTRYGDPFPQLKAFADAGATWTHIVDLDGARRGRPAQHDLIARLAAQSTCRIQCGGGVRARDDVEALVGAGVQRVVVGSIAARNPEAVIAWTTELGADRICVALDVRPGADGWEVSVDGWTGRAQAGLDQLLTKFSGLVKHVLVTDISRDGALAGANVDLMRSLAVAWPQFAFQASGGVAALDDLRALKGAGAGAAIVGRALYERKFALEDALAV